MNVDIRKLIREAVQEESMAYAMRDDDGIARQNEGFLKNMALAGGMALAGMGGVKAQADRAPQSIELSHQKEAHSAIVSYIDNMSQGMGANKSPEQMAAMKEARMYFEALRDGKQTQKPSQAAKVVIQYVLAEMKKLSQRQINDLSSAGANIHTSVNEAKTDRQKLRDDQVKLTDEERAQVITQGAVWDDGLPGVWKSIDKNGNVQYCSNTHRAMAVSTTLAAAIKKFPEIKATA